MYHNLKNIVFDFGGVLLDIDYNKTYNALSRLLGFDFAPSNLSSDTQKVLNEYEKGEITTPVFLDYIKSVSRGKTLMDQEITDAWNAMLIGWNPAKFELLWSLRKNYKLYLLSNTNEMHLDWVYQDLKSKYGIEDFDIRFFDKTYYSHLIGCRKPDLEIYEFIKNSESFIPGDTLFVDDLEANISAAKMVGWSTYHHDPNQDLVKILQKTLKFI